MKQHIGIEKLNGFYPNPVNQPTQINAVFHHPIDCLFEEFVENVYQNLKTFDVEISNLRIFELLDAEFKVIYA
jgi:hypothetical protein